MPSDTELIANRGDSAESQPNRYEWLCDKPVQTHELRYVDSRSQRTAHIVSGRGRLDLEP